YSYQQSPKTVVTNCDAAILYQTFGGKSEPLQTHLSNWFAVTQEQSAHLGLLLPLWYVLKNYFYLINLKRKRALLESNLPAIKVDDDDYRSSVIGFVTLFLLI
ncbi:MAG: hypothetical protein M3115_05645, partial [Thermoproteota archaeon]|nr:hypothetical protein [Thermoproteota archaeon]